MISDWVWSFLVYGGSFTAILYASFLSWYRRVWDLIPPFDVPDSFQPTTKITVLVPARNEADAIMDCLQSLYQQNYPSHLFEVIVLDDGSEDDTASLVQSYYWPQLRLIRRAGGGKKKAIEHGVSASIGELVVTTDADCVAPKNWLRFIAAAYEQFDATFIAAPVIFHRETNFLQQFQSLDLMGMMVLTGAGIAGQLHYLSNGANMAYPRHIFLGLGGYQKHLHASGDDVYLIHQVARHTPKRVIFIKQEEATVRTQAPSEWQAFWQQRIRWATKNKATRDWDLLLSITQSFMMCWFIILSFFGGFWFGAKSILLAFTLLGCKAFQDYHLLKKATEFFHRPGLMQWFWPSQVMHILYIALVGLFANLTKKYVWKGRRVH